jgi:hypothetical protein
MIIMEPTITSGNSLSKRSIFVYVVLALAVALTVFVIIKKDAVQVSKDTFVSSPNQIVGTMFPFIARSSQNNDKVLFFYSMKEGKLYETDFPTYAVYPSPDLLQTVVQNNKGYLYLISNTYPLSDPEPISTYESLDQFTQFYGWSPDGTKILFSSPDPKKKSSYIVHSLSDKTEIEIERGKIDKVYFYDNDQLLVVESVRREGVEKHTYLYSLITKERQELSDFSNFALNFFFSPDRKEWVIMRGDTQPESGLSVITLADTLKLDGTVLAQGRWADLQPRILFSPTNEYIAYTKTERVDSRGIDHVWIFNKAENMSYELVKGKILYWLDERTLALWDYEDDTFVVADLDGSIQKLHSSFYDTSLLGKAEKGILFATPGINYNDAVIRFFDFTAGKTRTVAIAESVRTDMRYADGMIYIHEDRGILTRIDPYTGERVELFDFKNPPAASESRTNDFYISGNTLFYTFCSEQKVCDIWKASLSAPFSNDQKVFTSVYHPLFRDFDVEKNALTFDGAEYTDDYTSNIASFTFDLDTGLLTTHYKGSCNALSEDGSEPEKCTFEFGEQDYQSGQSSDSCYNRTITSQYPDQLIVSGDSGVSQEIF